MTALQYQIVRIIFTKNFQVKPSREFPQGQAHHLLLDAVHLEGHHDPMRPTTPEEKASPKPALKTAPYVTFC